MKEFIEYAEAQGSRHASRYYTNITRMANELLFIVEGKYKNLREVLTVPQLMTVSSAEQIINHGLREGMDRGMNYKDIYQDIKERVKTFARLNGKSEVITRALEV